MQVFSNPHHLFACQSRGKTQQEPRERLSSALGSLNSSEVEFEREERLRAEVWLRHRTMGTGFFHMVS